MVAGMNPFLRLASVRAPGTNGPVSQAYVYGLFLGPIAIPCAGPFLVAALAVSVGVASAFETIVTFIVFGLGEDSGILLLPRQADAAACQSAARFGVSAASVSRKRPLWAAFCGAG